MPERTPPTKLDPRKAHRSSKLSSLPPLARTITKIVGIVPLPVRILIGALLAIALLLAVRSGLAARRARLLERQRGQLLKDVGLLQAALLPAIPARLGPVGTSAAYRPAEGPGAGGDFYDLFPLHDGRLGLILGDVSGHGPGSLPHTALVRFTLRAYLEAGLSPRESLQTANAVLDHQLGESFVTVALATYNPRERILVYATAGHPPPLIVGSKVIDPVTACSAVPVGIGARTGTRQTVLSLPGACKVCFHTDGVTEARVGSDLYGSGRLLRRLQALPSGGNASALLDGVGEDTDERPDDMAACMLATEGGDQPPRVLTEQLVLDGRNASARAVRFLSACGVEPLRAAQLASFACVEMRRTGAGVLLEVSFAADGRLSVELRPDNVAPLHGAQARRTAALGTP